MTLDNSYRDCLGRLDIAIQVIFTTELVLGHSGTAEGEGLVGPRPYHFLVPPPPLFALKRKIIKIKKDLKQFFFCLYSAIFSVFSLISNARPLRLRSAACFILPAPPEFFISFIRRNEENY